MPSGIFGVSMAGKSSLNATLTTIDIQFAQRWILEYLLKGQEPPPELWSAIRPGEALQELRRALPDDIRGKEAEEIMQKSFIVISSLDEHKWLRDLASMPLPIRPGIEGEQTEEQTPKRRIQFVEDSDIENRPAREWVIPGILPKSGIAMLFGAPGTYKSFLAIDWALTIGYGRGWAGRATKQGSVAYIAAEGSFGLSARIKAWKGYHQVQGNSGVRWYDQAILLQDPSYVNELLIALKEDFPIPPVLLIIDTLSRCSGGADENSNTEMAKIIAAADIIQQEIGCTVLIIHHDGKDKSKGPRGASSLIGNMETIISIDHFSDALEGIQIGCFKQKDAEKFEPIRMVLHRVQYGELTEDASIVLIKAEGIAETNNSLVSTKKSVQVTYNALLGKELTYMDWVREAVSKGIGERSAKEAKKELCDNGKVRYRTEGKLYYIPIAESSASISEDSSEL